MHSQDTWCGSVIKLLYVHSNEYSKDVAGVRITKLL